MKPNRLYEREVSGTNISAENVMRGADTPRDRVILGITGGIGSGKSTVVEIIKQQGRDDVVFMDADRIAHTILVREDVLKALITVFGREILMENGLPDRKKIGAIVFQDEQKRLKLNAIMHKCVGDEIKKRVGQIHQGIGVLDVPIPIQEGFLDVCDEVWSVISPQQKRVERVILRDHLSADQVMMRLQVQPTDEEYRSIAHEVILNAGPLEELCTCTKKQWQKFLEKWRF